MNFINRLKQDPFRPILVTYAVLLLYCFLTVSILLSLIRLLISVVNYPGQDSPLSSAILTILGYLLLFFIISQIAAGKNWARWLLVVGFAMSLFNSPRAMQALVSGETLSALMSLAEAAVLAASVAFLFQRRSSAWFTADKPSGDHSADDDGLTEEGSQAGEFNEMSLAIQSVVITAKRSRRRWTLILMLSSQLLCALLIFPWFYLLAVLLSFDILPGWRYAVAAGALILLLLYPQVN